MRDAFLKRLVATIKCAICGHRYLADNVNILGQQEDLWFLSVFCSSCQSQGLVAAVVKDTVEALEAGDFENEPPVIGDPVNMDDVLDMHNFLKNYRGALSELMSEK